jgi:hypothetical protein
MRKGSLRAHAGWVGLYVVRLALPARFTLRSGNRGVAVDWPPARPLRLRATQQRHGARPAQRWRPATCWVVCGRSVCATPAWAKQRNHGLAACTVRGPCRACRRAPMRQQRRQCPRAHWPIQYAHQRASSPTRRDTVRMAKCEAPCGVAVGGAGENQEQRQRRRRALAGVPDQQRDSRSTAKGNHGGAAGHEHARSSFLIHDRVEPSTTVLALPPARCHERRVRGRFIRFDPDGDEWSERMRHGIARRRQVEPAATATSSCNAPAPGVALLDGPETFAGVCLRALRAACSHTLEHTWTSIEDPAQRVQALF